VNRCSFRGYPSYLQTAAQAIGRPEAALPARRIEAVTQLSSLCAQAACAPDDEAQAILRRADAYRDQLRVALQAAEAMLADLRSTRGFAPSAPATKPKPEPQPTRASISKPEAKAPTAKADAKAAARPANPAPEFTKPPKGKPERSTPPQPSKTQSPTVPASNQRPLDRPSPAS